MVGGKTGQQRRVIVIWLAGERHVAKPTKACSFLRESTFHLHLFFWLKVFLSLVWSSSHLILSLCGMVGIGISCVPITHEIPIPIASRSDVPFILKKGNGAGAAGYALLYLTVTVLATPISPNSPKNTDRRGRHSR